MNAQQRIGYLKDWFDRMVVQHDGKPAHWSIYPNMSSSKPILVNNSQADPGESWDWLKSHIESQYMNGVTTFAVSYKNGNNASPRYQLKFDALSTLGDQKQQDASINGIGGGAYIGQILENQSKLFNSQIEKLNLENQHKIESLEKEYKYNRKIEELQGEIAAVRDQNAKGIDKLINSLNNLDGQNLAVIGQFIQGVFKGMKPVPQIAGELPATQEEEEVPEPQQESAAAVQGTTKNNISLDLLMQGLQIMLQAGIEDPCNKAFKVMQWAANNPDNFEAVYQQYINKN